MGKQIVVILCLALCCLLLVFSAQAAQAAREGLALWGEKVLPALFPFFVITGLLESAGAFRVLARLRPRLPFNIPAAALPALLISSVAGAPAGARICGQMLQEGSLTPPQAQRYAALFNLASPMFVTGALAVGILGDQNSALPILLGQIGSAVVMLMATSLIQPLRQAATARPGIAPHAPFSLGAELTRSIGKSVEAMLRIGGTIVMFIILVHMVDATGLMDMLCAPFVPLLVRANLDGGLARALVAGFFEMTNGCNEVAGLALPAQLKAALCSAQITSGGLCILMQSMMFLRVRALPYLALKQTQALLAGIATFVLYPLFGEAQAWVLWDESLLLQNASPALALLGICAFLCCLLWLIYGAIQRTLSRKI